MEVIEFLDNTGQVLVKRIPDNGQVEIKWGSQLTVRESQEAIFFRDGKSLGIFTAGRHILKTQNIPVVGKWVTSFGYGEDSPFRAEVLFVGKQLFTNFKWGTSEPILFKDSELQMVRLRSFGSYSIQVKDSLLFVNKLVGTMGLYSSDSIADYLRGMIISKFNVVMSRMLKTVFDIPSSMDDLNIVMKTELFNDFEGLGIQLHDFYIQSISLPEEVQKMIDSRSGINAFGNLDQYMKLKIANALDNQNGGVNSGLDLGAGIGMGMAIPNMIQQSMNNQNNESVTEKLKMLKELLDLGAISQQEFEDKKKELLKQI
jgi:membrane protease subunit (stomatin/prohibitin family)